MSKRRRKPDPDEPMEFSFIRGKKARKRFLEMNPRTQATLAKAGVTPRGKPHPDYRSDESFYKSTAWRTLRYAVLKNSGGRCGCCGASSADVVLHVDHVIPRFKAPHLALEVTNLQCLCEDCNMGKGAWDDTDWRARV